ncbi:MAG TPA: DUF1345 domain-containing protein [Gaiellaceae bacterium]|nr:DUF1345 domain-containing protein [Gaiellaceae bacterium]
MFSAGSGCVVLIGAVLAGGSWSVAGCAGWDGAALAFLGWTWLPILRDDPVETARRARIEDSSRAAADAFLLAACVASLVAVALVLVQSGHDVGIDKALLIVMGVSSVALAWATVHTVFALHYARLYYSGRTPEGIDFHADDDPDYRDFAYVALTIGMTFQVSDTDLTTKPIRQTAIKHALLSYLFGAVIVAIMINIVGSLLSK